ncbi:DMT family transporter [Pseudooceanicola sp. CBS1P-1]|uniref:EamA family transporter n=2 Tax=Paracoccaceae TaxID=31989 RepID=A0A6L7G8W9_9RHOB|nr:DMT family transporter [Pseudooceanicola endophyticus]MXN19846.1 EamA family transporter [Pseudooceanicola albus]
MLAAMMGFAVEDALFKVITRDVSPGEAMAVSGLCGIVLFSLLSARAGEPVLHEQTFGRRLMLRSVLEIAGRLFFGLALAYTPLSSTSAILQAAPLVVTAGAVVFFGEKVGPRRWSAICIGLLGVMMILRPTPEAFRADALLAVAATLGFAGRDLGTRAAPKGVSGWQLGTLGFIMLMLAGVILMIVQGLAPVWPRPGTMGLMALEAVAATSAYAALTRAMQTGEIAVVSPFRYTRLIAALAFAVLVFGERPDLWTLGGGLLIVVSGIYTLLRSGKKAPARAETGDRAGVSR